MRAVVQRVSSARVSVDGRIAGSIGNGLVVLVGVAEGDDAADVQTLATKLAGLRVFRDDAGRMNRAVTDVGGEILVVSQFTLQADVRRGRRPSFTKAADPALAQPLVDLLVAELHGRGIGVATGVFGAMMEVDLVNDGPVTLVIDVEDGTVR